MLGERASPVPIPRSVLASLPRVLQKAIEHLTCDDCSLISSHVSERSQQGDLYSLESSKREVEVPSVTPEDVLVMSPPDFLKGEEVAVLKAILFSLAVSVAFDDSKECPNFVYVSSVQVI